MSDPEIIDGVSIQAKCFGKEGADPDITDTRLKLPQRACKNVCEAYAADFLHHAISKTLAAMPGATITGLRVVGVGNHHPPIQWLNTPLDARQRGNPAAVACWGSPPSIALACGVSSEWAFFEGYRTGSQVLSGGAGTKVHLLGGRRPKWAWCSAWPVLGVVPLGRPAWRWHTIGLGPGPLSLSALVTALPGAAPFALVIGGQTDTKKA